MITKLTEVLGCEGYNIVQNNGELAGQTVFHFHMHLIPRYKTTMSGWDGMSEHLQRKINWKFYQS